MRLTFPDHFPDSLQLKAGGSLPGQGSYLALLIAACRRPYQYPFVGGLLLSRSAPIWGLVTLRQTFVRAAMVAIAAGGGSRMRNGTPSAPILNQTWLQSRWRNRVWQPNVNWFTQSGRRKRYRHRPCAIMCSYSVCWVCCSWRRSS
jgi:hypothetical protein